MVGPPFILVNKNGRRTLLNAAQITGVNDVDVLLTDTLRRRHREFPADQEVGYFVRIDQPDGPLNFMFPKKEERNEFFDKIIAAISPSAVIESAPGLPHTWPALARMSPLQYIYWMESTPCLKSIGRLGKKSHTKRLGHL